MNNHSNKNKAIEIEHQNEYGSHLRFFDQTPHILLVEDDQLVRRVNTLYLSQLGCRVTTALTGKEAYSKFNKTIDLVLLDIGLPDTAGTAVCQQIRMHPEGLTVPIIALTAFGDHINDECLSAGFNEVATKPILLNDLYHLLHRWLVKQKHA